MRVRSQGAVLVVACALASAVAATAQNNDASAAAGCAACSGCGGLFLALGLGLVGLHIALLIWVARDAKNRGMDSAILWMLLVLFLPLIGFIVYIFARPQGNVVLCPNCGNKHLQASLRCPHCGFGS